MLRSAVTSIIGSPYHLVPIVNSPDHERFERAYRRLWGALHRGDQPGLSQHERQLLHHVPAAGGVALTDLARHLALPKSTASVVVKDLERRGFVRRRRDARDERRLAIVLTAEGRRRVASDTVLEPEPLAQALDALAARRRAQLLDAIEALADAAERLP
jgi:MarR family transcriptional regulator, organic hydroperoxide resistance regulator